MVGDLVLSWWLGSGQKPWLLIWLSGDRNSHGYMVQVKGKIG